MFTINKLTGWYFNKKALPYWIVLGIDCCIIIVAGLMSLYFCCGGEYVAQHFWPYVLLWTCSLPFFIVGMRMFSTYTGILRYSSFVDLGRVVMSLLVGFVLLNVCALVLPEKWLAMHITWKMQVLVFVFAMMGQWGLRVLTKYLFDATFKNQNTKNVFIYGVRECGVSLAKSIRNQEPRKYTLAGFVSPEDDLQSKFLMDVKVRRDGPNLVKHMQEAKAEILLVSPLQRTRFRNRQDLIGELTKAGIKIMMMPAAEEWDGKSDLTHQHLHEVEIEALLPRDEIKVDMALSKSCYRKCVHDNLGQLCIFLIPS